MNVSNQPPHGPDWLDEEDEPLSVRDYVTILVDHWAWIVATIAVFAAFGFYNAWTAAPAYKAKAVVQIDHPSTGPLGDNGSPLLFILRARARAAAQSKILETRAVLGDAAERLNLNVQAKPRHWGNIGAAWARRHRGDGLAQPPLPWLGEYAWGGETIQLERFTVPEAWLGERFTLIAGEGGAYRLQDGTGQTVITGSAGRKATATLGDGQLVIHVANLVARPGTHFVVSRRTVSSVVSQLRGGLSVIEPEADGSGILELSFTAGSPQAAERRLAAITEAYVEQSVESQTEQIEQTLAFLESQLPKLEERAAEAESKLREYQAEVGAVDLSVNAQNLLEQVSSVEQELSELELKESELLQTYTAEHPALESLRNKRAQLKREQARLEQQLQKLPRRESRFMALKRDATAANELYTQLLERVPKLKVSKAGITGIGRVVDEAYADGRAVGSPALSTILWSLALGLPAGIALAFLRHALRRTLREPDLIERRLGLPVYATVPHSRMQARLLNNRDGGSARERLLSVTHPQDNAVESLRGLRTSLQFARIDRTNRLVSVTSPTPGCGKSFISANLAFLAAEQGRKVLLLDGDMRRGYLHHSLGLARAPGLSQVLAGQTHWETAIQNVPDSSLDFLPCGLVPPNPSELLLQASFSDLTEALNQRYDLIVLDSPATLNVTDGIIIATAAAANFLVARAEVTTLADIELSVQRLRQNEVKLTGVVFNGIQTLASRYGYGKYGHYGYSYELEKPETG